MLKGTYFPQHDENRMRREGDVEHARAEFFENRHPGVEALLSRRYGWMKRYLEGRRTVVELGAGAGLSPDFLESPGLILADVEHHPWIHLVADGTSLPFAPGSIDAVVCSHMLHHVARPTRFLESVRTSLRLGGVLLVQDAHTSLFLRVLMRLMRHEGWSYDVDVFDEKAVANDPSDPWSANCAIPEMLFRDEREFQRRIRGFRFLKNDPVECLLFPLSGGIVAKTRMPKLPRLGYRLVERLDEILARNLPDLLAVGRSVAMERVA